MDIDKNIQWLESNDLTNILIKDIDEHFPNTIYRTIDTLNDIQYNLTYDTLQGYVENFDVEKLANWETKN